MNRRESAQKEAGERRGDPRNRYPAFSAVGLELEYMLVDALTLDCVPIADQLLKSADGQFENERACADLAWSNEFFMHVIELKNPCPAPDLDALQRSCQSAVQALNRSLTAYGARLMPTAMHPWMDPRTDARRWPHGDTAIYDTYARIFDCNSHGWANLQSMHINLPFSGDAEFARLHAAVRLILPLIPALAASSPIADEQLTGFADSRLQAYRGNADRFPAIVGRLVPEPVTSEAAYCERVLAPMYREIAGHDPAGILQHEWLNSHGAIARFERNAIEIRITDTQECVPADLAVATAIVQAIKRCYDAAPPSDAEAEISTARLEAIFLRCIQDGEQAEVADVDYLQRLGCAPIAAPFSYTAADVWRRLLDIPEECPVRPPDGWQRVIAAILEHGTLSRRISRALGKQFSRTDLREVYRSLCTCLNDGHLFIDDAKSP
jgi:carboxylate-amine ligase